MPISFNEEKKIFKLDTAGSTYVIKIIDGGYLAHLYYGAFIPDVNLTGFEHRYSYASFSPNPAFQPDGPLCIDVYPLEIGCNGCGDMRVSSLQIRNADGNASTDMRYVSHRISDGKPAIPGMPALYSSAESPAQTLEIDVEDKTTGATATLVYSVFEKHSAMTRAIIIRNNSEKAFEIERALSFCLDMNSCDYNLYTLYGRHAYERNTEIRHLSHGMTGIQSKRGSSSHQQNPFMALLHDDADEDRGDAYGFNLVYSANFVGECEVDFNNATRVVMGINPSDFGWTLQPGEVFHTPEAVLVYSDEGLGGMSRTFHRLYNNNLVRGEWRAKKRPLLINNWEGTYFDFDDDKLVEIAKWAKETGIEMFVMDDGWFGKRDDDRSGLGDWVVNEKKLKGGIGSLVKRIKDLGLKFGIWYEPEMISPDSDIYRAHPDWCIHVPDRECSIGRTQLVMDMTRQDVRDYIFNIMCDVLANNDIDYVKWDFNRNISEAGSALLPPEKQKEFFHRYVLGTYEVMGKLVDTFPHLLLENCSGGGGRYDPGMMYYSPQIWCSDNTDAIERINIQFGSSLCYPASVQSSHVSASSRTSYETKRNVAMWGSFGYELDPAKISEEAREEIKGQIADYHKYYDLIHYGDLYRIITPWDDPYRAAWMFVSPDKAQAQLTYVTKLFKDDRFRLIKLKGLDAGKNYLCDRNNEVYSGALLMRAGFCYDGLPCRDGESWVVNFTEVK